MGVSDRCQALSHIPLPALFYLVCALPASLSDAVGVNACLYSVGPLTDGKTLCQHPPFSGALPQVIQMFSHQRGWDLSLHLPLYSPEPCLQVVGCQH